MTPPEIFDRSLRRQRRERMLAFGSDDRWLLEKMAEELDARLDPIRRTFGNALLLGGDLVGLRERLKRRGIEAIVADPSPVVARQAGGVACDEDRLPFADQSFDLVLASGTLDTVSDLPGALVLIRRILTKGGLFLGALSGAGSLAALRSVLQPLSGAARFHPQVDVRSAGDLLARAGFALPVAESETINVRYRSGARLFSDLRANGLTNVLAERHPLERAAAYTIMSDSPLEEQFAILTLTGWAPER